MPTEDERIRWAIYAAILAALKTGHPRRFAVARALEELVVLHSPANGHPAGPARLRGPHP